MLDACGIGHELPEGRSFLPVLRGEVDAQPHQPELYSCADDAARFMASKGVEPEYARTYALSEAEHPAPRGQ